MKTHTPRFISIVLALSVHCGPGNSPPDSATNDAATDSPTAMCETPRPAAPTPTTLFEGMYSATTNVETEKTEVTTIGQIRMLAGMYQWDTIDTMAAPSTPVGLLLSRIDRAYFGENAATSEYSLERTFRNGLAAGRNATDDNARQIAKQYVEKSLLVLLELAMHSELRNAIEQALAGCWINAREHWDRAAVYYSGLDGNFRSRSMTTIPNVWGDGTSMLTDENMGSHTVELLGRGLTAIQGTSARTVNLLANELTVYTTKYFFLSALNYGHQVQTAVTMGTNPDKPRAEGTMFFEGLVLAHFARSNSTAVANARARWRGSPMNITRLAVLRDSGSLYSELTASAINTFLTGNDNERWSSIARIGATVDVLDEALTYSGQNVATLRDTLATARSQLQENNTSAAASSLRQVQTAIESVARAGKGM